MTARPDADRPTRRRGRAALALAVGLAAVAGGVALRARDGDCDRFSGSAFDPQDFPHPSSRAALDQFLASDGARRDALTGQYRFERTVARTASSSEVAVFESADGRTRVNVQRGGPGWAVAGLHRCL